jgi:hypothetical protein
MDMYWRREETGQDTTEIPPEEFFSIYDISEERIEIAGTLPVQTEVRLKVTLRETKQESTKDIHGYDVVHQHSTTIQLDVQRRQHTDTDDQRPNATSPRALRQEPSIWSERHPGLEVVTKR